MTALIRLWPLWLALLTGIAGTGLGWEWRDRSADIRDLRTANAELAAQVDEANKTLATERNKAQQLADIGAQHEEDKRAIESEAERTIAALRAGNLRLRQLWRDQAATAELSQATASAAESDGRAADREASAARIIAAADRCDAQVRGLQAVVRADRQ